MDVNIKSNDTLMTKPKKTKNKFGVEDLRKLLGLPKDTPKKEIDERLRQIYKDFGIKFDVRAARKLLVLDKDTSKKSVTRQLIALWDLINEPIVKEEQLINKIQKFNTNDEAIIINDLTPEKLTQILENLDLSKRNILEVDGEYKTLSPKLVKELLEDVYSFWIDADDD